MRCYATSICIIVITTSSNMRMQKRVFLDISVSNSYVGRVEFELYTMDCPITCENFRALCTGERQRPNQPGSLHFKGKCFHRIVKGFIMQGGRVLDSDKQSIGESVYGGYFPDENFKHKHSCEGLLSMANSGPDTNSCQFFITFAPAPHLDGKFQYPLAFPFPFLPSKLSSFVILSAFRQACGFWTRRRRYGNSEVY